MLRKLVAILLFTGLHLNASESIRRRPNLRIKTNIDGASVSGIYAHAIRNRLDNYYDWIVDACKLNTGLRASFLYVSLIQTDIKIYSCDCLPGRCSNSCKSERNFAADCTNRRVFGYLRDDKRK